MLDVVERRGSEKPSKRDGTWLGRTLWGTEEYSKQGKGIELQVLKIMQLGS